MEDWISHTSEYLEREREEGEGRGERESEVGRIRERVCQSDEDGCMCVMMLLSFPTQHEEVGGLRQREQGAQSRDASSLPLRRPCC